MKHFVILNAAPGRQIKSYGPKCLLKLKNNEQIIDRQVKLIRNKYKSAHITCVGGFEINKLIKNINDVDNILDCKHFDSTNTLYSFGYALYKLGIEEAFVLHGDLVFTDDLLDNLISGATTKIFTCDRPQGGVQCNIVDGKLNFMMWNIDKKLKYWSEIAWISKDGCQTIKKVLRDNNTHRMFLFEALNYLAEQQTVEHVNLTGTCVDIDKTSDLKRGNKIAGLY